MTEFLKRCHEDRARALDTIAMIDAGNLRQSQQTLGRPAIDMTDSYRALNVHEVEQLDMLIAAFEADPFA